MVQSDKYSVKEHLIITILFIQIIGILWYFNPVSETISCNANYYCKIEHKHIGFKIINSIYIQPHWTFDEAMSGFAPYQERHIVYNTYDKKNKPLLKKGFCHFKEGDVDAYKKCTNNIHKELNNINAYIKNPEGGLKLIGSGGINYLQKYIGVILLLYIIGMLINRPLFLLKQLISKFFMYTTEQVQNERENKEYYGISGKF